MQHNFQPVEKTDTTNIFIYDYWIKKLKHNILICIYKCFCSFIVKFYSLKIIYCLHGSESEANGSLLQLTPTAAGTEPSHMGRRDLTASAITSCLTSRKLESRAKLGVEPRLLGVRVFPWHLNYQAKIPPPDSDLDCSVIEEVKQQ